MTESKRGANTGHETRARVLEVALELFLGQGYQASSMQQIADRLGITKAALYYHFSSKSDIVGSLVTPLVDDLERAMDKAARAGSPQGVRAAVLEGYVDLVLAYRGSLLALMRDVSATPQDFHERVIALTGRAIELITGPGAGLEEKVRATQALSALGDPLIMFPEVPSDELRQMTLDGAWRLLAGTAER